LRAEPWLLAAITGEDLTGIDDCIAVGLLTKADGIAFRHELTRMVVLEDLPTIHVRADKVVNAVSPFMTGMCIEDVNHEIYGGLYSQMVFGESFAEPTWVSAWVTGSYL
jgi:hypothetical protein